MGNTPQAAPTVQSVMKDPNFLMLPTPADKIAVLSKVDSNFAGLKPEVQMEVISHMSQALNLPPTMGAGPLTRNEGESEADFIKRVQGASPQAQQQTTGQAINEATGVKEDIRTALPYAGAAAASLAAGPEAGMLARLGLAGLGGAAGSVASHAIPGGNQPALLSKEGALDVAGDAVKQAVFELGAGIIGKGIGGLVGRMTSKVSVEEAAAKIASTFSPEITPLEFGEKLRETLPAIRQTLGAQKGQALDDIINKFPVQGRAGVIQRNPSFPGYSSFADATTGGSIEMKEGFTPEQLTSKIAEHRASIGDVGNLDPLLQKGKVADYQNAKPLIMDNTAKAVNQAISTLEGEKKLTPSLFAAGEAKARTLNVLHDIQNSMNSPTGGYLGIKDLDTLRSSLFQLGQGIDRPLPKSIVGSLAHAVHDDIGATLGQFGAEGKQAFQKYEAASSQFRETADILQQSTFKRILNANVNQPEKVLNILMQAPESNIADLQTVLKNSKNGPQVIDSMKHLALEKIAGSPQGLNSLPQPAREVVFGNDLPKIEKFFSSIENPQNMSMLSKIVTHAGGVVGGGAAGAAVGHPMLGIGTGEMLANYLIRSGTETRTISSTQLAVLLGNPTTRQLLMRAAQTPAAGQASGLLMRALGTYLELPTAQPPQPQAPISGGASIGQQLQSKGIALPQAQPNVPGMPLHPNQGQP